MGDKALAKRIARDAGVPTIPGAEPADQSNAALIAAAAPIGFPLMIKAAAGGGGRGMRRVPHESEFAAALDAARSEAQHAFGDGRLLLERALTGARHIEVQVFADAHGNVDPSRRARLLGAAAAPEADRGKPLAGGRSPLCARRWAAPPSRSRRR